MPLNLIAILVNSVAGKGKAFKISTFLQKELTVKQIPFEYFLDDWPIHLTEYSEVWVVGGDGTVNFFLNKYPDCSILIVVFKGGTGNDIAWKLYGDISTEEQLELVLKAVAKPVDAASCNNQLFINGIGVGFDGEVLKSIKTSRFIGGHLGYLLIVIRKIFRFKEEYFRLTVDGREIEGKFLLVTLFNSSRTGGGFYVAPTAEINDGVLNLILCEPLPVIKRLKYLPVIEKGKHLGRSFIKHTTGKKFLIECEDVLAAQIDGELIYAKSFEVNVLPNKFMFKY